MKRKEELLRQLEAAYAAAEDAEDDGDAHEAANQYSIINELERDLARADAGDDSKYPEDKEG